MSVRREVRLRKEFLFKCQQTTQLAVKSNKKRLLREAVEEDKDIPTEIRHEARRLQHESEMDIQAPGSSLQALMDDEFANIGTREPKVCVTTSRDPSSRLKQFAKEIKLCIPNSQSINRGGYRVDQLVDACRSADFTDIVVLNETRGQPDAMIVCHLPFGPTAYFTLSNCVLRHDIPECTPASQAYPHLILDNMTTKVGSRVAKIIQALYPVPREESKRIITFANRDDFISFRHHMIQPISSSEAVKPSSSNIALKEAGPRFEMQPYEVRLGTLDQDHAEKEWVLKPYMNTARKKHALS